MDICGCNIFNIAFFLLMISNNKTKTFKKLKQTKFRESHYSPTKDEEVDIKFYLLGLKQLWILHN